MGDASGQGGAAASGRSAADLFELALGVPSAERVALLERECEGNEPLLREVESLLSHLECAGTFMESSPVLPLAGSGGAGSVGLVAEDDRLLPGQMVGRYRIIRVLGEGGMGVVYLAEQESPRREVALKLVRGGLMSRSLRRRFEHEAELLGRLSHPGIAQIFEAGTADLGSRGVQPFFAMEYVQGTPFTRYADERGLGTKARLELVARVCDAMHHAHQRGLVHRDIKPGNIYVDGAGQPKILDFGVARATDADVMTTTARTDVGQLIGTLAYMSPEQIAADPLDIDARADVYAIGLVMYELLCGRQAFNVANKAVPEALRIVREDEPSRLSLVQRSFRGDIETIVATAIDRDRSRRYQSAAELAADIRRFLREEPIAARPPSTLYQLRKFARRNRGLVGGLAAVLLVLTAGVIGTSIGMVRAMRAARVADLEARKASKTSDFLQSILTGADSPNQGVGAALDLTVREVVRRAAVRARFELAGEPDVARHVHVTIGQTLGMLGEFEKAAEEFDLAMEAAQRVAPEPSTPVSSTLSSMAHIAIESGDPVAGEQLIKRALDLPRSVLDADPEGEVTMLLVLGLAQDAQGRMSDAKLTWERALEVAERSLPDDSDDRYAALNNLALVAADEGRLDEAYAMLAESERGRREVLGVRHPIYMETLNNLAVFDSQRFRFDDAEKWYDQLIAAYTEYYGPTSIKLGTVLANKGTMLRRKGDQEGSEAAYRGAIDIFRSVAPVVVGRLPNVLSNLASLRQERADFAESEALYAEALELARSMGPVGRSDTASILANLAGLRVDQGRWEEVEALYAQALEIHEELAAPNLMSVTLARQGWAVAIRRIGRAHEAVPILEECASRIAESYGPMHPSTVSARAAWGLAMTMTGRAEEAEVVLRDNVDAIRSVESASPQFRATAEMALGECLRVLGNLEEAEGFLLATIENRRTVFGPDHPSTQEGELLLARLRIDQGRPDEARPLAQRIVDWREHSAGPDATSTREAREVLARAGGSAP